MSAARTSGPSAVVRAVDDLGDLGLFGVRAVVGAGRSLPYLAESLRQARILLRGTTGLIAFLSLLLGAEAALFGSYFLRAIGAEGYVGVITALADSQVIVPLIFGYAFAAKVGCGTVAEIGAMRVSEEIDSMQTMGVDPMRYVVGTRVLATLIYLPIAFPICVANANLGSYLMAVVDLRSASAGTFASTHWPLQIPTNYLASFAIFAAIGMTIMLVAAWFGDRVRGGPVEVGNATSKAMIVNLVMIHVLVGTGTAFFYGTSPTLTIGG